METKIAIFQGKRIRKVIYNNEWWFSVIDIITILTDSLNPRDYWYKMKIRDKEESGVELSTICRQLKLAAPDGKLRAIAIQKDSTGCVKTRKTEVRLPAGQGKILSGNPARRLFRQKIS